jgi:hypothetical protein
MKERDPNVIDRLIDSRMEPGLRLIANFITDIDLLRFSQVCRKWRRSCQDYGLFRDHETRLLKRYDLLTSEDVDSEYEAINKNRSQNGEDVDEIVFYCYLKSRIEAVVRKTSAFEDHVDTVFKGTFEAEENRDRSWTYEDCAIFKNKLAVGHPNGFVALINLDTKSLEADFQAYEVRDDRFRWSDIALNSTLIAVSPTMHSFHTKLFFHDGTPASQCEIHAGRLVMNESLLFVTFRICFTFNNLFCST